MTPPELANAVAVVAIGRNEGERLIRCFQSIPPEITTVYVDSGSTDGSVDAARARVAAVVELDMARPFTAARARNAGFSALDRLPGADAIRFIQFVDGDCELESGWLARAATILASDPRVAIVCGRRRERFPEASVYNRICDAEWDTPIGRADACGGDAMMRAASLRRVGGFDDAVVAGEEPELCARIRAIGGEVWRVDAPMTIHDAAILRLRQWWRRAVRGGFGYAQVWRLRGLYGREVMRAIGWGAVLPAGAALLAIVWSPWWLLLLGLPLPQIARIALRAGGGGFAWRRAAFLMLAKAPELQGILSYAWQAARSRPAPPASYK